MECKCKICRAACRNKPGWFRPGEAEKVAEFLGLSLQNLFDEFLGVDYWGEGEKALENSTFLLAPARKGMVAGDMYPFEPRGTCIFFKDELCLIHPVKPFECAFYDHTNKDESYDERKNTVEEWKKHQKQIKKLLGRKPSIPMPSDREFISMFAEGIMKGIF